MHFDVRVLLNYLFPDYFGLAFVDMFPSEEELPVEIAHINRIKVNLSSLLSLIYYLR